MSYSERQMQIVKLKILSMGELFFLKIMEFLYSTRPTEINIPHTALTCAPTNAVL